MRRPRIPHSTTRRGYLLELAAIVGLGCAAWPLTLYVLDGVGQWGRAAYLAVLFGLFLSLPMGAYGRRLADAGYSRAYAVAPYLLSLLAVEMGRAGIFLVKFVFVGMSVWAFLLPSAGRAPE